MTAPAPVSQEAALAEANAITARLGYLLDTIITGDPFAGRPVPEPDDAEFSLDPGQIWLVGPEHAPAAPDDAYVRLPGNWSADAVAQGEIVAREDRAHLLRVELAHVRNLATALTDRVVDALDSQTPDRLLRVASDLLDGLRQIIECAGQVFDRAALINIRLAADGADSLADVSGSGVRAVDHGLAPSVGPEGSVGGAVSSPDRADDTASRQDGAS